MKIKRYMAILLSIILIIGNIVYAEETDKQELYARYAWDGSGNKNMSVGYLEGGLLETEKEKTKVIKLRTDGGANYVQLNCADSLFKPNNPPESVAVTVRYFDEYAGAYFTIDHTTSRANRVAAEKVTMTGDNQFKEHTFYFDECYFKNDNAGADFLIACWSSAYGGSTGPVYIEWVEVKESFPQKPVIAEYSTGSLGNTFDYDDDKILTATLKNLTQSTELTVDGKYEILSYDKRLLEDGVIDKTVIAPQKVRELKIQLHNVNECSKYFIRTTLNYSGAYNGEIINGDVVGDDIHFAVANKRKASEKPNPMMRTQIQFQFNNREPDMTELYQMASDAGFSGIREYSMWNKNSPKAPYKEYVFKPAFDLTKELDMTQNMAVAMGHPTYGGETHIPVTDEEIKAISDYAGWFVETYGDRFEYYEVWNEPNVYGGFNKDYATPQQYTELTKAIYKRVKAANPSIKVTVCSTATLHDAFIDACIEAGILDYCDVISVHPYDWDTNLDDTGKDRLRNDIYRERAAKLRKKLEDAGHPEIEISWTELGVRSGSLWASEIAQASYLTQLMAMIQGDHVADNIYQFNFVNPGLDNDLKTGESHWGLLYDKSEITGPYSAKLSYLAMAGYNKLLSDVKPSGKIIKDKTSVYKFTRNSDGKDVLVLWTDNSYDNIGINLGTNEVEVYDMYSNKTGDLKSKDGKYSFTTTFEPMYIVGNFSAFEECVPIVTIDNARAFVAPSDKATFTIHDTQGRNLRIDAEARDNIEIAQNDGMQNGKAEITVATAEETADENTLRIKMYDGDDLVFITRVHVVRTQPMKLVGKIEKVNDTSSRTEAHISITNMAAQNTFSGKVTADFTAYGGKVETRYFENVKPKETVTVKLNVPQSYVQRTFNFNANVELDYGYKTTVAVKCTQLTAEFANEKPPISGKLNYNDWQGGDFYAADRKMDVRYKDDWSGKDDCSVLGKLKWDDENLYLLAVVTDNVFFQDKSGSDMWSGDGIQFAISTAEDRKLSSGGSFTEFGLSKTPDGVQLFRFESLSSAEKAMQAESSTKLEKNVLVNDCECSVEKQNGKYVYRARIPWSEILPGVTKIKDRELGFSMLVNDNDGAGRGWLQFSDGIGQTKSANLYSILNLSDGQ